MPRNPNLRIDLECDQGKWKFVLHKDLASSLQRARLRQPGGGRPGSNGLGIVPALRQGQGKAAR